MDKIYTLYDYEEAYYHMQWNKCKEIGIYLLKLINNYHARDLLNKLNNIDFDNGNDKEITKLLSETKICIRIYSNF